MVKPPYCSDRTPDRSDDATIVRRGDGLEGGPSVEGRDGNPKHITTKRAIATVCILSAINLFNYMDRLTIAGVLKRIQTYYMINDSEDGLIQTAYIGSSMICAPIIGYLGDRFTRKYIMASGLLFWAGCTLAGSFIPKDYFWAFVLLRGFVGVGEASYWTTAPTIIADMFTGGQRTRALMLFFLASPVGSGLGYIVGANVAAWFDAWQYAFRVTPIFGVICVILLMVVVREPERGHAEGATHLRNTSYLTDLKHLVRNKSFVLSTLASTCGLFTIGALSLWMPLFLLDSISIQGRVASESSVGIQFGAITVAAGCLGVTLGAEGSRRYKKRNPRAEPLISAFGMLLGTPFVFFTLVLSRYSTPFALTLVFLGVTALSLNWALVTDILLKVVIPTRRSAAESVQIVIAHLLGDAGSSYLVGLIADRISRGYNGDPKSPAIQFVALQNSLYITTFVSVLGGGLFLATAMYMEEDQKRAEHLTHDTSVPTEGVINPGYKEFVNTANPVV